MIIAKERFHVTSLACTKPEDAGNQCIITKLSNTTGLSRTTDHRLLDKATLKPHEIVQWRRKSSDSEFAPKQTGISGLYRSSSENTPAIFVREKSQIQALDQPQPMLSLRFNQARRHAHACTRHSGTCLITALPVHQGTIEGRCADSHTHVDSHKTLHVIIDNYSAHKHQEVVGGYRNRYAPLRQNPTTRLALRGNSA